MSHELQSLADRISVLRDAAASETTIYARGVAYGLDAARGMVLAAMEGPIATAEPVHVLPETDSDAPMHELSDDCHCHPWNEFLPDGHGHVHHQPPAPGDNQQ
jgi:hypothetical protein